jgi:hypothetical protein
MSEGYFGVRRSGVWKYLSPAFDSMRIEAIRARQVEALVMKLLDGGLSAATVNHVLRTLKIIFAEAHRLDMIGQDPICTVRQLR